LRKKAKGSIIDVTRRSVLGFGLEELHLAPKNRVSGYSSVLLRRLKLLLLSGTSVSCCLAEGDIARVMLWERERRLLLSWTKAGNDSKGRNKATRSEGDDLGDSAARALMRHGAYFLY